MLFQQRAFRGAVFALMALSLAWLVNSCVSTPVNPPTPVEAVTDAELQVARDAIAEAEAVGAVERAPEPLSQARSALADAEKAAESDPEAARGSLKKSVSLANQARDASLASLDKQAESAIAAAEAAGAAQLATELLTGAKAALTKAREQTPTAPRDAKTSYEEAIALASEAKETAQRLALSDELRSLFDRLDQEARAAIAEAEEAGADQYAPTPLAAAREALTKAKDQTSTAPDEAKASYQAAIDRAREARDAANRAALAELDAAAQQAISEAEAAEAEQYSPRLLAEARSALSEGRAKASSDPKAARATLKVSAEKAGEAREEALKGRTQALLERLDAALDRLKALQPDQWDPEGTGPAIAQAETARATVTTDYAAGLPLANEALVALDAATMKLSNRLLAVQDLRVQAQKALDEAETADAYVWVPDLVESANDAFFTGTGAWKQFRLDAAEEGWSTALFQARSATAQAQAAVERKRTEQLMLETMKKLEAASGKTIVDPQDNIVAPEPWDGQKELEKLKAKPVSVVIPDDGSVVVLGEKQRVTYLDEAKVLWAEGVKALEVGDLNLANESFLQAQRLIDTYLAMAVDKIYTVRLIPERRDSLWRISEYDEIYNTPWDWPKIWQRNQRLIQNPDLIYPGWQLIIPPQ